MMSLPTFHTKAMYIIIHNEKDPNIKTQIPNNLKY